VRYRATDVHINWTWEGTKHTLAYNRHPHDEVQPILDVLTLLEESVTDKNRTALAKLLRAHIDNQKGLP
jgi:hypothetical protein